jgi:hypothetical protein
VEIWFTIFINTLITVALFAVLDLPDKEIIVFHARITARLARWILIYLWENVAPAVQNSR